MSVHVIYYQQGHKMMEAVETEEAYRRYRDSQAQQRWVETIRHPKPETDVSAAKRKLVQFNYSCLPTEDGCLKGAKRLSKSVGMDIDHLSVDEVNLVAATAIEKKDELGLLMLERSARGGGLHVVFRRHPEMDQEANLRWASDLLGVEYDAGAKDITRVFFATTSEDLLYLHNDLFDNTECEASEAVDKATKAATTASEATQKTERTVVSPTDPMASETVSTASETVSETAEQNDGEAKTEEGKTSKEQDEKKSKTKKRARKRAKRRSPCVMKVSPTTESSTSGGPSPTMAKRPRSPAATPSPLSWPSTSATSAISTDPCSTASSPATTVFPKRKNWLASIRH